MIKKTLHEVSTLRIIAIFALIITHSLCFWNGGWTIPEGVNHIDLYRYVSGFISGFQIELFVLISGYLYSFSSRRKEQMFTDLMTKKIKRLIIPCLFYGCFYYFIFLYDASNFSVVSFVVKLFTGPGHLWFLPMLFWCFLCMWVIDIKKYSYKWILPVLAIISIMPIPVKIPFGIQRFFHFMFYFYGGYFMYAHKNVMLKKLQNKKSIMTLVLLYIILVFLQLSVEWAGKPTISTSLADPKVLSYMLQHTNKLLFSICGILALWLIVCKKTEDLKYSPPRWIENSNKYCYGIYIYHQFIMYYLYERTSMPQNVNSWVIPIIGLLVTLPISYLLTRLTLYTKWGKFMIG